jgi:hypothetical protein
MDAKPTNHRRTRRHRPRRSVRVICFRGPLGLGANLALGLRDLSEAGVCLLLAEALPAGQEVEVHLESVQHNRPVKVPGRVVWVKPADDGRFLAGVQFEKQLPHKDLQALAQLG